MINMIQVVQNSAIVNTGTCYQAIVVVDGLLLPGKMRIASGFWAMSLSGVSGTSRQFCAKDDGAGCGGMMV